MPTNNMSTLLNKIERRLGTRLLNLPKQIAKGDPWVTVIEEDTLDTFSRYFPNKIRIALDNSKLKNGYYIIDESISQNCKIIGVRDIAFDDLNAASQTSASSPYGIYDFYTVMDSIEDIGFLQLRADTMSLFNNGLYLEFEDPNKIKICTANNNTFRYDLGQFKVDVFIKHSTNLSTIAPTKMEIFERLAICDVAGFLYQELKYFDGLDSVYGNIDLKLAEFENKSSERSSIVQELENGYVNPSNDNQPIVYTV